MPSYRQVHSYGMEDTMKKDRVSFFSMFSLLFLLFMTLKHPFLFLRKGCCFKAGRLDSSILPKILFIFIIALFFKYSIGIWGEPGKL